MRDQGFAMIKANIDNDEMLLWIDFYMSWTEIQDQIELTNYLDLDEMMQMAINV